VTGPQFLVFYILLIGAATVVAVLVRRAFRGPGDDPGHQLNPYDAALLAGGLRGAARAAVSSLAARGALGVTPRSLFTAQASTSSLTDPVELAIVTAAGAGPLWPPGPQVGPPWRPVAAGPAGSPQSVRDVLQAVIRNRASGVSVTTLASAARPPLLQGRDRLVAGGMLMTPAAAAAARLISTALMLGTFGIGLIRYVVGSQAGRPVGYLTVLLVVTGLITLIFLTRPGGRTRRGDRVLARLRRESSPLRTTARTRAAASLGGADVAMAVALFGTAVLPGLDIAGLDRAMRPLGGHSGGGDSS
jgi:uncharacterized protein (TIGR04222 family)